MKTLSCTIADEVKCSCNQTRARHVTSYADDKKIYVPRLISDDEARRFKKLHSWNREILRRSVEPQTHYILFHVFVRHTSQTVETIDMYIQ
jgi:hypothetical protein